MQRQIRYLGPSSWSGESHHEHRPLCKKKLRSYITGQRIVVPLVGNAIVLWGFCLSSGCACCRYLAPRTHRSSGVTDTHWHCFLFRRHVQHILGWTHRLSEGDPAGFNNTVNSLIKIRFYLEASLDRHGETSGGGQERAVPESCAIITKLTTGVQHDCGGFGQNVNMATRYGGASASIVASIGGARRLAYSEHTLVFLGSPATQNYYLRNAHRRCRILQNSL